MKKANRLALQMPENKAHQDELTRSEVFSRNIFNNAGVGLFRARISDGKFLIVNHRMARIFGYDSVAQCLTLCVAAAHYVVPEERRRITEELSLKGEVSHFQAQIRKKDGTCAWVEFSGKVSDTEPGCYEGIAVDITDKKRLEAQLQQARKMETIGTLAGGIAHDFNNILFPILGHSEILMDEFNTDHPVYFNSKAIYSSALRAKDLIKQILTFARREESRMVLLLLPPIIKESLKLLRSTLPASIELTRKIGSDLSPVTADPTQIHQIVMNLVTNAYHALDKKRGAIEVSLTEREISESELVGPEMSPGPHLCLTVSDDGMGMSRQIVEKVFDPFFTTKDRGKGTWSRIVTI